MGWFWADSSVRERGGSESVEESAVSGCPVIHSNSKTASGYPVVKEGTPAESSSCPVIHQGGQNVGLNPLNNVPSFISDRKQPGQKLDLPTCRTTSSIPKGSCDQMGKEEFWEYPSPQQMYNAMVRKGKVDPNTGEEIPEDAVESMVFVHNYLNEGCWEEILDWEKPHIEATARYPKLLKFMGKPSQVTPRARWYHLLGTLFPSKFCGELPFDRHDWIVLRPDPMSTDTENPGYRKVRYVIDFYGGPDDEEGLPTFNLDVRPALDNLGNAKDRFNRWVKPIWDEYFPDNKQ
ncbi:holocytochrome c synthase CYC3 Ecym_5037 [Eremothecium cymbalariae DBVPG|uniref:Holocytochrome c-type synthase n=1 Tax=Eremothecium cymbalariae (strain CBS 270.75 / DBVPG 7215 / KCTC 17166 / NRRL Y-17582) TaxID=931890 RepID=I6NCP3_ERECY|nr:hypothetical protein Ecym_5037 [Eremothecium cymbalariae DBVPG\